MKNITLKTCFLKSFQFNFLSYFTQSIHAISKCRKNDASILIQTSEKHFIMNKMFFTHSLDTELPNSYFILLNIFHNF